MMCADAPRGRRLAPRRWTPRRWTTLPSVCMLAALAAVTPYATAAGQAKKPVKHTAPGHAAQAGTKKTAAKPYTGPTTLGGIYTDEQAERGSELYAGSCRSCHTPASHTGATFQKYWAGKPLSDLFGFVSANMPKNDPGSLDPYDVADVVAYLLKINGMPPGQGELPPDVDSLKKVRIVPQHSSSSTKRTQP